MGVSKKAAKYWLWMQKKLQIQNKNPGVGGYRSPYLPHAKRAPYYPQKPNDASPNGGHLVKV